MSADKSIREIRKLDRSWSKGPDILCQAVETAVRAGRIAPERILKALADQELEI